MPMYACSFCRNNVDLVIHGNADPDQPVVNICTDCAQRASTARLIRRDGDEDWRCAYCDQAVGTNADYQPVQHPITGLWGTAAAGICQVCAGYAVRLGQLGENRVYDGSAPVQRFVSRVLIQACDDNAEAVRFETPKDLDHFLVLGTRDGEETVMFRPPAKLAKRIYSSVVAMSNGAQSATHQASFC